MKSLKLWAIHGSFLLFFIFFILALVTQKSVDIEIGEGERVSLAGLGVPATIGLSLFTVSNNSRNTACIFSDIDILSPGSSAYTEISVNKPASFKGLDIYQKGYYFGFKSLMISFRGRTFDMTDLKEELVAENGLIFRFEPFERINGRMIFNFVLADKTGAVFSSGLFDEKSVDIPLLRQYGFRIIRNNYRTVSVLRFVSSPFLLSLGVFSVIFLLLTGVFIFYPRQYTDCDEGMKK